MRLPNMFNLLTASALLIGATTSANALVLTIDDLNDAAAATVIDDATDSTPNNGNVFFSGSIGSFTLNVSNGFGFPSASRTGPQFAATDLSVQSESVESGMLRVELLDAGLSILTGASGDVEAFSNIDFGELTNATVTTSTMISIGGGAFETLSSSTDVDLLESVRRTIASGQTFDLKTVVDITHTIDDTTPQKFAFSSTDGNLRVSAIPLPAALPLFLTALVGLGFVGRHRRRQAA